MKIRYFHEVEVVREAILIKDAESLQIELQTLKLFLNVLRSIVKNDIKRLAGRAI